MLLFDEEEQRKSLFWLDLFGKKIHDMPQDIHFFFLFLVFVFVLNMALYKPLEQAENKYQCYTR